MSKELEEIKNKINNNLVNLFMEDDLDFRLSKINNGLNLYFNKFFTGHGSDSFRLKLMFTEDDELNIRMEAYHSARDIYTNEDIVNRMLFAIEQSMKNIVGYVKLVDIYIINKEADELDIIKMTSEEFKKQLLENRLNDVNLQDKDEDSFSDIKDFFNDLSTPDSYNQNVSSW
jgi:uncharacterized short protein YbdD (DUF466 family)